MEMTKTKTEMIVSTVGKVDPKRHLQQVIDFYELSK